MHIHGVIPFRFWMPERKCKGVGNFATELVAMAISLKISEKKLGLIICNSIPTIWCKDCENRSSGSWDTSTPSELVRYDTKLVAMATSLEESEKLDLIKNIHANTFHLVRRSRKSVCRYWYSFAPSKWRKKKKLTQAKYIARSATALSPWRKHRATVIEGDIHYFKTL